LEGVKHTTQGAQIPAASEPLKGVRDVAFTIAIFLYFAGFQYLRTLFHDLGVDIGVFDIPTFAVFIYAIEPLESVAGVVLGVIVALFAWSAYRNDARTRPIAVVVTLMVLFFGLQYVVITEAHSRSLALRRGHARPVAFTVREADKMVLSPWLEERRARCDGYTADPTAMIVINGKAVKPTCWLFFVAETKDALFIFAHKPDRAREPTSRGQLVELRKDHLASWLVNVDS
jgi:hypothetical protein